MDTHQSEEQTLGYVKWMDPKPIRETVETLTRLALLRTLCVLGLLVGGATGPSRALAEAVPLDARLIWAQGDRAYLAARDSLWLPAGAALRFLERDKLVASGEVTAIHDAILIAAKITSGSLKGVKHFDRVRVTSDRTARPLSALRVGYPSPARVQPFFECRTMALDPRGYRADTLGTRSFRLVRDSTRTADQPEPDTLLVRLFDDSSDEEIALERGELDAAVFWPGEASPHIREVMRWQGTPKAVRDRGVVAIVDRGRRLAPEIAVGTYSAREDAIFDRLNVELFRGDLERVKDPGASPPCPALAFDVDSICPAHPQIGRILSSAPTPVGGTQRVLLTYRDLPREAQGGPPVEGPVALERRVYLIACPVISRPELRPYLETIDLSILVNRFDCVTAARKP